MMLFGVISALAADVVVDADYDGDGQLDRAIWRPETATWFIELSGKGGDEVNIIRRKWGRSGDVPVPADYDGDGKCDLATFSPLENLWNISFSRDDSWQVFAFGDARTDLLVPADYTGDGRADLAVYAAGRWQIFDVTCGEIEVFYFGFDDDTPVPADHDGDGTIDFAVLRKNITYIFETGQARFRTTKGRSASFAATAVRVIDPRKTASLP